MKLNDLKIVGDHRNTKVFLDGVELHGVTSVKFENSYDDVPRLSIEMYVGTHEIDVTEVVKEDGK